jgi:hypothetical protein
MWRTLAVGGLLACAPASADDSFAREKWVADFEQLKAALTSGYPNLEWQVERGVDLPAIERRARDGLAAAHDDSAARLTFERFLRTFADGHMSLTWPAPVSSKPADALPLCSRLGFRSDPDTRAIARNLLGYRSLTDADSPIAGGLVEIDGRRIGVLRIPIFMADGAMCLKAIQEIASETDFDTDAPCDEACADRLHDRTEPMLVAAMMAAITAIVGEKPDVLLVDVAGNGGGNDSAIAAARMLTAPPLPSPRVQFVRGSARSADLAEDAQRLRNLSDRARAKEKVLLSTLLAALEDGQRQSGERCDLSPLWQGKRANCSNLVSGTHFAAGLVAEELPAALRKRRWASMVSSTARYDYTPGLWTGPLVILADSQSASATELFAAMLQDAGRARVIGAPTVGSGCGWTLPKRTTVLAHSGAVLTMPDCARVRRDGTNELDGVQPDVLIGFRAFDTTTQRAHRLEAALRAMF